MDTQATNLPHNIHRWPSGHRLLDWADHGAWSHLWLLPREQKSKWHFNKVCLLEMNQFTTIGLPVFKAMYVPLQYSPLLNLTKNKINDDCPYCPTVSFKEHNIWLICLHVNGSGMDKCGNHICCTGFYKKTLTIHGQKSQEISIWIHISFEK